MIHDIRTRINFIVREAKRLDGALANIETAEEQGDHVIMPVDQAKLLLSLDKIAFRLEQIASDVRVAATEMITSEASSAGKL